MKAIIVIDMPKVCGECRASFCGDVWYCYAGEYRRPLFTENIQEKPSWCPLRPLPEKDEEPEEELKDFVYKDCDRMASYFYGLIIGRNNVINEILGENDAVD